MYIILNLRITFITLYSQGQVVHNNVRHWTYMNETSATLLRVYVNVETLFT